ncbi:sulfotransferase family 2 domain-containing protein [Sphingomicrobium clamense]|uniref:Sulfotransferase family 2 domain-containing protein n=1 Tax=Sphingomicrobium clamense TaxID=2851013 RepID=A0ABS6V6D9_9SPHN|nr:sulfotransferase family 2 domain-containing protein [Sphingomicrobium sp. B8]MBW0145111.1 sulfotransferase family 2 domain-containing protein [Sphingomicrobium sp. B8]
MIISHRHRFIFIKTMKTAGTSVEMALSKHCGPDDVITAISDADEKDRERLGYPGAQNELIPQTNKDRSLGRQRRFFNHMAATAVRANVPRDVWNDYFKFTVERNPFDKAVSHYFWATKNRSVRRRPSVDRFIQDYASEKLSNWPLYTDDDRIILDDVIRYEELEEGLRAVSERLGIAIEVDGLDAKGSIRPADTHYSNRLLDGGRRRVEIVCARELAYFGYRWESDDQGFTK